MRSLIIGLFVATLTLVLDQVTKIYAFNLLDATQGQIIHVLPFFSLVKVYNYGVSFGMFNDIDNGRIILSIVGAAITIALCIWLYKVTKLYMMVSLGMIIGGAIGNIIDRVRFGAVSDFLDFHIGDYHWPAFNIADSTIFIGVAILFLDSILSKEQKDAKKDS